MVIDESAAGGPDFQELADEVFVQGAVDALLTAMELRDAATAAHARRVAQLATQISRDLLGGDSNLTTLRTAALLHDIGKLALSDGIIGKAGPLNEDERTLMRLHPEFGSRIAERVPVLADAAEAILSHQEYFDGTGYPRNLHGSAIPLEARIIAVADAFDVITNERPYKRASTRDDAVVEITRCAGTQFDPDVVGSLRRVMCGADAVDADRSAERAA
jgi:putative nucleotidyltransferase with HDIG domain